MMRVATAFSGIGSPEMALKQLGIDHEVVFACEIDKFARQSYKAIYNPTHDFHTDVREVDGSKYDNVDLFVFGFPCQDYSIAGKRAGLEGQRGTLFYEGARITKEMRPKYFIAENVKGLLSSSEGKDFETIMDILRHDVGYHCTYAVLNTKDFGIPQNRERVFIVGFRDDLHHEYISYEYPKQFELEKRLKDVLEDEVDEKYYLSNKLLEYMTKGHQENHGETFGGRFAPKDKNDICNSLRANTHDCTTDTFILHRDRGGNGVETKCKNGICPTITSSRWENNNFLKFSNEARMVAARWGELHLGEKDISGSLTTCIGHAGVLTSKKLLHKGEIRRLTPKECWRLQGFPDWSHDKAKEDGVSDSQLYKQAGNSITVDVMMHLIKSIVEPKKVSLF